jgi:Tfp pilus assembly protein PilF
MENRMSHHLLELSQKAGELMNAGRKAEAAELYSALVEEQPDWEHGEAFLFLANCQEDLGQIELAEKSYRAALSYEPSNDIFLGGFASFLYLHGKPEDAFSAYLNILATEKRAMYEDGIKRTMIGLKALGERLGWSEAEVVERIERHEKQKHKL